MVNIPRLKGVHYAIESGSLAAEAAFRAFQRGETPEEIVRAFDTLNLADTYAAVAYYLRHREEVEAFLAEYDRAAEEIRKKIEERQGPQSGLKDKLLRRLAERQKQNSE